MLHGTEKAISATPRMFPPRSSLLPLPFPFTFRPHLLLGLLNIARQASSARFERFFQPTSFPFGLFERIKLIPLLLERFLYKFVLHVLLVPEGESLTNDLCVLRVNVQGLRDTSLPLLKLMMGTGKISTLSWALKERACLREVP